MTKPRYNWKENNVLARCPDCDAITSFDDKGYSNTKMGISIIDELTMLRGDVIRAPFGMVSVAVYVVGEQ